jgi:hypothetical protein
MSWAGPLSPLDRHQRWSGIQRPVVWTCGATSLKGALTCETEPVSTGPPIGNAGLGGVTGLMSSQTGARFVAEAQPFSKSAVKTVKIFALSRTVSLC